MKQDIAGPGTTVTLADTIDARLEHERQMRRGGSRKAIVVISAAVAAGLAVILAALTGGNGGSPAACEDAARTEVRALLAGGDTYNDAKPRACNGMSDEEVDQITGRLLGEAFAG